MEEQGLLSVIVPAYNGERFLAETLESILKSTYKNLEVLLIDDGSTDRTGEICKEYMSSDKRIKYYFQENQGIVGARNRGLQEAKGEFVTFCDQDDLVVETHYSLAVGTIQKQQCDMYICSTVKIYDSDKKITRKCEEFKSKIYENRQILEDLILPAVLRDKYLDIGDEKIVAKGHIWNCVIKKDLIRKYNLSFKKFINFEDDTLMRLDVLLCAEKVCTGEDIGYYWRTHMTSKSNKKEYIENIDEKLKLNRNYIAKKLEEKYSKKISCLYERREKIIDITLVLDNELGIKRDIKSRRQYLEGLKAYIENGMQIDLTFLKNREKRYKMVLREVLKGNYFKAYYLNKMFVFTRDILHKMKMAYWIENFLFKTNN